jgi:hypothetical protein
MLVISETPKIALLNFDVREREELAKCFNDGYSMIHDLAKVRKADVCYSNWPIQFSLFLSDKYCKATGNHIKFSPMNMLTCIPNKQQQQMSCLNTSDLYKTIPDLEMTMERTVK